VFANPTDATPATPLLDRVIVTDTVSPARVELDACKTMLSIVSIAPRLARCAWC
jgi:hypothetical protein